MTHPHQSQKGSDAWFVWSPARVKGGARIESSPIDLETGEELELFDGVEVGTRVNLGFVNDGGTNCVDFVYDIGRLLIVSRRVRDTILRHKVPHVTSHDARLVGTSGDFQANVFWLNINRFREFLDPEASLFERSKRGIFRRIDRFSVRADVGEDADLVGCEETSTKVFSKRLVDALLGMGAIGAHFQPLQGSSWP